MDHKIALKQVLALSALAYAVQAQNYLPYIDGQCTKPVTNFTVNGNAEDVTSSFYLEGFPEASRFSNPVFGGAEAQDGSGGYDVWWKISPTTNPGCGQALMKAYSQDTYDRLAFNAPAGNVIMFANSEGCIYSHIPVSFLHSVTLSQTHDRLGWCRAGRLVLLRDWRLWSFECWGCLIR